MKLKLCWMDGREERCTESELPLSSWPEIQEHIRLLVKSAVKYSDLPIPEGLLRENESL